MNKFSRRRLLQVAGISGAAGTAILSGVRLAYLQEIPDTSDPLGHYPNRDWERVYRDQYRYDSSFTFVCSPNDTHACRLRAFVRNGIVVRTAQNYDSGRVGDLMGNKATEHWNPRGCEKGYTIHRRVYGPYRLKYPLVRLGWKQWADDGFPELDAAARTKYKFDSRGTDTLVKAGWDEVYDLVTDGMIRIAQAYSGDDGRQRLERDGYPEEMIEATHGAGTRTFKLRGGMGLLGVIGKYGMYRWSNMLALLDSHVRGVEPPNAYGGRKWSNYTWHGDQAPGMPFVHGLQASDVDFNDLRLSRLHVQVGKNLVENKMADSHFFQELVERGGKIVTVSPEYGAPATKSDYWLPIRPATDTALFLGIAKIIIDQRLYDEDFVRRFTDLPLLIRTDTLERLRAADVFPDYYGGLMRDGASFAEQGITSEQYAQLGDFVVWHEESGEPVAVTRDDVGDKLDDRGVVPALSGRRTLELRDGSLVQVATLFDLYRDHLRDYDLDTVQEITGAPRDKISQLAIDIATIKPTAIHIGEGLNHWFHATLSNRAIYLPLMLTGNIGKPGAGCHTWAGNYKAALFQGSPWSGPGFAGWISEDPFAPNLGEAISAKEIPIKSYAKDEEPAYWNHGDRPLIVETPKYGRKVFTGATHMPTPTKVMWFTNVNLINNAKWAYDAIKNVNPLVDLIISQDIEMTASCELADVVLPANSWLEFETPEVTASCSNPFLQIWKGGIAPVYDTRDDVRIMAEMAKALGDKMGDRRFADYWRFALDGRPEVYIDRLLDGSSTTNGYTTADIMAGKYGEPGAALMLFRTYPRIPFYEQIHDSVPFFTDTGRLHAYCDIPEAIAFGENFVVHREGPEATPYLPNVIVSSNPLIRPDDFGIPEAEMDADMRTIRNIKMPWAQVKRTKNPLWEQGFSFYLLTPKTRHTVHSQWAVTDWQWIWASNFGDPYRRDKRAPGVGDHQIHMNPEAARALGLEDGDYVYVDANPADRPYRGWTEDDPFYKVARCMVRVKFNPAYPYNVTMMKHGTFIATEKTVKAHETRPDGRAISEDTGYQASFRYGSQQSLTRDWSMPMHQTDTLFHKAKTATAFIFGGEADNHALNTVPKETLVRIVKAESGGLGGIGRWIPAGSGLGPGEEDDSMQSYLSGGFIQVRGAQ